MAVLVVFVDPLIWKGMPGLRDEQRIREDVFLRVSELIFQETVASTIKDEVTEILGQVQFDNHSGR